MSQEGNYIVSARKYRPVSFDTVVGQKAIAETLKNAIKSGKLAHAYLFCGPRGVGKTTCARIFAKTINCLHPQENGEACETCESCVAFNEQRSLNIHELDAASNNSVEDIRQLIEQVQIPPQIGQYKVFIIDEVHMLSTSAFNAFLKTLEEPPAHAIFILATTEKHKILPTILSRCQIYDFQRMSIPDMVQHLAYVAQEEGYTAEPSALNIIAQKADGGMRDALSIFDQTASFCGGNITYQKVIENLNVLDYDYYFRLVDAMLDRKVPETLLIFNEILGRGFDGAPFINGFTAHLRDLLVSRDATTAQLLEVSADIRERYVQQAQRCKPQWLYRAIRLCNNCDQAYRTSRSKRLQVELTLIECTQALDDDGAAGRSPIVQLKPIFSRLFADADKRSVVASETAQPQGVVSAPLVSAPTTVSVEKSAKPAEQPKSKTLNLSAMTVSIFGNSKPAPSSSSPVATSPSTFVNVSTEYNAFSQGDLLIQWQAFIQTMPQSDTAIAQRMLLLRPQLKQEGEADIVLEVLNEEVRVMMETIMPSLLKFLRLHLRNSKVNIVVQIVGTQEAEQRSFNKRTEWDHLLNSNENVAYLVDFLQLELE